LQQYGIEVRHSLGELADDVADVVICNHSLEHCARPLDELKSIRRVLKEGGSAVVVVPLDDWRTQRVYRPGDINHHLYAWTPLLLGNLIGEAGLRVERVRMLNHAWPPNVRSLWGKIPVFLFDVICFGYAIALKRRQLIAVAIFNDDRMDR
jgi:SAM-dependent methyltransferase